MPVKENPSSPAENSSDQTIERIDKRIHVALPLRITYWDKDKKPGLEMACTYDISSRGARITSLRCIKEAGEIVAIERGRNKTFCRVVWIGEPNSELHGQVGLQCIESERAMFEHEIRDLEEAYDAIAFDPTVRRPMTTSANRRRLERFTVEGIADLLKGGRNGSQKARLKDLSEMGCLVTTRQILLPGTDLKLVLNVANYSLSLKGQVKHSALDLGIGIEFNEIRKGDRQTLKYLLRKLEEEKLEEVFDVEVK
ncbi:MAG TPA: PilZ domain-containing protein [Terriglobales bacterium]|nr:PilZ domain-containing protein [Terriglobales bacterium]